MKNKDVFNNKQRYLYKQVYRQAEFFIYCFLSFILPFFIGHPQILIGSFVNFFLIRTAQYFDYKYVLSIVFFPSVGVYFAGALFGASTGYLVYFLPFIWISNLLFIYVYKKEIFLKKNKLYVASIKTSILKAGFLFFVALVFVYVFGFPKMFLVAMGGLQVITAIVGSLTSSYIFYLEHKKVKI